ncbi:hypothetical protein OPQ81_006221 [Rhizoctonia solani]|nr:hypothetical protein OPQ81_006221 [Rhizoctonia solani]
MSGFRKSSRGGAAHVMGMERNQSRASARRNPNPHYGTGTFNQTPGIQAANVVQEELDEYGAELGPEARVWKAYVREADKFDIDQVDGWNRSLDVTLIFAALFTAICTAFVIESGKSLKEDATEISARRLDQITSILLVVANVTNPPELNTTKILNPQPFSPQAVDVCVNVLWFFSLILSAAVSLIAILAKEWCYLFISGRIGDHWSQTKRRQQRWGGIDKWKMEQVIMVLPSFIHLAFLSFAIGLCIYLGKLHPGVAVPVILVTLGSILVYVASTLLPLFDRSDTICPYSTSISRLIQRLWGDGKPSEREYEGPGRIAIEALKWLIKTSEDPKITDIALQAIAGADPEEDNREILKASGADTMISWRLIALDPFLKTNDQLSDLYTRALYFFHPVPSSSGEKGDAGATQDSRTGSATGTQKNLNRELERKIRKLRDMINKQITTHVTSSRGGFLPTSDNIQALRIGSTAASHCLRSLKRGFEVPTQELFDSAIELLDRYRDRRAHLNREEIHYLMTGTAMLLSSLLVDCPPRMAAQYVMRLLRIADRVEGERKQLPLKDFGLPLAIFALSQHDYPGWTHPPPLSPILRAERSIEAITYYVSREPELKNVSSMMINLALLELLSDPEGYELEESDIVTIMGAFELEPVEDGVQRCLHTLPTSPHATSFSRTIKGMATMISNERGELFTRESAVIGFLTVLDRARADDSTTDDASLGQVYAFVIECVLNLTAADLEAYGRNIALDVMEKFYPYLLRTEDRILELADSLGKKQTVMKLKEGSYLNAGPDDPDFVRRLFSTGQAWLLINLAIESKTAEKPAWRCLSPFVGDESIWASPELANQRLEEERRGLAERYRSMWENDKQTRHTYLKALYHSLPPVVSDPSPVNTPLSAGT